MTVSKPPFKPQLPPRAGAAKPAPTLPQGAPPRPQMGMLSKLLGRPQEPPPPKLKVPPPSIGPAAQPSPAKLDQVREVVTLLNDVVKAENAALKGNDIDAVRDLAERKERLARLYNDHVQAIAAAPRIVADMDADARAGLKALAEDLEKNMGTNARLLKANLDAANRLMKIVVEAVKEHRANIAGYSAGGGKTPEDKKGHGTALAYDKDV